jgi:RND family efflux transporter MFP subunit
MSYRSLLTGHSKNSGIKRSQRLFRILGILGLVSIGVVGTIAVTQWRVSSNTPAEGKEVDSGSSYFSAESIKEKSEAFIKYVSTLKTLIEPAPQPVRDPSEQSIPVRVFVVGSVQPKTTVSSLTGVVRARHEINLAFRVSGKIRQRYVEVGQRVEKGTALFDLDPEDYGLQLRTAQANLDVAEATVQRTAADAERAAELQRVNASSESEYERVQAERAIAVGQRQSALKQLELARNQLMYCRLSADAAGVITSISAEAGQVVTAGSRVAELAQADELEAVIDIPENRIPRERPKDSFATFWSMPSLKVQTRLREISPIADPVTRTFRSRFSLIDPPREVKLGMTTTVEWSNPSTQGDISIPATAVFQRDHLPMVWVVDREQGSITATPIKITTVGDREIVVSEGLITGQTVVSAGVQKLDEKQRVRVWESLP